MNSACFKLISRSALITLFFTLTAFAQTTAFNFQGRLNDGSAPANGSYDLQFKLFNAMAGGTQIGGTVDRSNSVLVNGVFSTTLDFGGSAFTAGSRFLEISVRPSGSPNAHVVLGARQQLLAVPYAVQAISAQNAASAILAADAVNAVNATNAVTSQDSLSLGGVTASNYARLNIINPGQFVMDGNVRQSVNSNGLVKAMVFVNLVGEIFRCYNGATGQTTGTCGFTSSTPTPGVYSINFGFPVNERFVSITVDNTTGGSLYNYGANTRFNGNNLEVFVFQINEPNDTRAKDFMVIVY